MEIDISDIKFSKNDFDRGIMLPNQLSPKLAYLSGIIIGDGSICYRKEKKDYILKCVGNPKDECELYHQIIGPYFKEIFGFAPNMRLHDSGTTYGFIILSKCLLSFLTEKIGLMKGKKDGNLRIPEIFRKDKTTLLHFLRGLFDTDGCMCFKRRYKSTPYYPVVSLSSASKKLIQDVAIELEVLNFRVVRILDYKISDDRFQKGFSVINRVEMNGFQNLERWISTINFSSPKHLNKIENFYKKKRPGSAPSPNSGGKI